MLSSSSNFPILPREIGERWFFDGAFTSPVPERQAVKKGAM
jgi:predicted acylesterase/phospholipase RssA